MADLISREKAIAEAERIIGERAGFKAYAIVDILKKMDAESERLTDKEQRIFLSAMERERKVCKEVDEQFTREPYEDSLVLICKEIERKVKGALWT